MRIKNLILIPIFSALICVGAFIRIPTPVCPVTLQILFTNLAGVILGGKRGALSVVIYVLLGLSGIPVFAGGGGIGYVFQPTFGFLIGMIMGTYVTGRICHSKNHEIKRLIIGCISGIIPIFAIGTAYNVAVTTLYLQAESVATVVWYCLLPLPWDIILCIFTAILGKRILIAIKKQGIGK